MLRHVIQYMPASGNWKQPTVKAVFNQVASYIRVSLDYFKEHTNLEKYTSVLIKQAMFLLSL